MWDHIKAGEVNFARPGNIIAIGFFKQSIINPKIDVALPIFLFVYCGINKITIFSFEN